MSIPAGYQIHITSWENDGDNYKTIIKSGLTAEDAAFYRDLALRFYRSKLGNNINEPEEILEAVARSLSNFSFLSEETKSLFVVDDNADLEDTFDNILDNLTDNVLSRPDEYYDRGFCRAVDEVKIYYIESPIIDVTEKFN